jgi:hypothetical protein
MGLAVDANNNILIADQQNQRIRKVSPNGIITTIAGTGVPSFSSGRPALGATLDYPTTLFLDRAGNLYVTEGFRIARI